MVRKMEEIRKDFADTKLRSMVIIIVVILALAVVVGYVSFRKAV